MADLFFVFWTVVNNHKSAADSNGLFSFILYICIDFSTITNISTLWVAVYFLKTLRNFIRLLARQSVTVIAKRKQPNHGVWCKPWSIWSKPIASISNDGVSIILWATTNKIPFSICWWNKPEPLGPVWIYPPLPDLSLGSALDYWMSLWIKDLCTPYVWIFCCLPSILRQLSVGVGEGAFIIYKWSIWGKDKIKWCHPWREG